MTPSSIRDATVADAAAIQAIYAPYVRETFISFELEPPEPSEIARRIDEVQRQSLPWLVAVEGEQVAGYAYASRHRERAAYATSVDVAVYLAPTSRGRGLGKALYAALFERLEALGKHMAFAGIALPNEASVRLHAALGFTPVGVYREVGFKFGRYHDVGWWQRRVQL
ncbi:MAG: arsinothricin resistance N-acetyltransferase ArsN1 family B [Myxococcaceae bacterium]